MKIENLQSDRASYITLASRSLDSLIHNMQPAKIAILLVVGLCATQSLNANPISELEDALKDIMNKAEDAANDFEKKAWGIIGGLKDKITNIPKCMESEKPKLSELINQAEQGAMQCITQAMSDAKPASEKLAVIIKDLIPLAKTLVPGLMKCEAENQNPITLTICVVRVVGPAAGQIKNIMDEVKDEIPELKKLVEDQMIPLFQQCSTKVQDQVNQVKAIIADLEKCVANSQ